MHKSASIMHKDAYIVNSLTLRNLHSRLHTINGDAGKLCVTDELPTSHYLPHGAARSYFHCQLCPAGQGNAAPAAGRLPDCILCLPQSGTQAGGDGPLLLVQTPEQITRAAEEMHTIRRIFLSGDYTPAFKANFYGEAHGHWDANTLVIETRNLKSLAAGAIQVERWTNSTDGKQLEIKISNVGADGAAIGTVRTSTLGWRTGDQVLEWMCED